MYHQRVLFYARLQVPLDPEILYISHALLVKMFDWGFQFLEWAFVFFPPSRVPFREKKDVKGGREVRWPYCSARYKFA